MVAVASVWKKKHDDLKAKRNSLFAAYTKDPQNFLLAREIKALTPGLRTSEAHLSREAASIFRLRQAFSVHAVAISRLVQDRSQKRQPPHWCPSA